MDKQRTLSGQPGVADTAISEYIDELSRQLRRRLPGAQANEIAEETESHLRDQFDELVREGASAEAARAAALAGFGPAAVYAEQLAASLVETKWSRIADRLRRPLYAVVFAMAICAFLAGEDGEGRLVLLSGLTGFALALPCAFACSIGSRRPATLFLLACAAVLLLVTVGFAGFDKTTMPNAHYNQLASRRLASGNVLYTQAQIADVQKQLRLLREGMAAYATGSATGSVPADLRADDGYLAPLDPTYITADGTRLDLTQQRGGPFAAIASVTAKKSGAWTNIAVRYLPGQENRVPTLEEARARWQSAAPTWMNCSQKYLAEQEGNLRSYQAIQTEPLQFRPTLITWDDLWGVPFTAILVVLDAAAAVLGRWAYLRRRQERRHGLPS